MNHRDFRALCVLLCPFRRLIFAHKITARRSRNHKGRVIGVSALDNHTDTQWVNEGLKWLKDRPGMGSFIL